MGPKLNTYLLNFINLDSIYIVEIDLNFCRFPRNPSKLASIIPCFISPSECRTDYQQCRRMRSTSIIFSIKCPIWTVSFLLRYDRYEHVSIVDQSVMAASSVVLSVPYGGSSQSSIKVCWWKKLLSDIRYEGTFKTNSWSPFRTPLSAAINPFLLKTRTIPPVAIWGG